MRKVFTAFFLFSAVLFVTGSSALAEPQAPEPQAAGPSMTASEEGSAAPEAAPPLDEEVTDLEGIEGPDRTWVHFEEPCGEGFPVGSPWTESLYCGSCGGSKKVVRTWQTFCDQCRCVNLVTSSTCKPC